MKQPVLVIGSVAFDDVETPFGKRDNALGGSAVYFSLSASNFTTVRMVGVAGDDYPQTAVELLKEKNVDTTGLEIKNGKTFRWGGKYDTNINLRETLYTELNLFADFQPVIPCEYKESPYVFLGNIQPSLQMDVLNQIDKPKFVALDTMNLWIDIAREDLEAVLKKIDLLLINDSELWEITGEYNLLKGLKKIHDRGIPYVVVKKGEHGAYLSGEDQLFFVPAFPVYQPTDPTGAGDSFAGGMMGYIAAADEINFSVLKKGVVNGAIIGSICVEHFSVDGLAEDISDEVGKRFIKLQEMVTL